MNSSPSIISQFRQMSPIIRWSAIAVACILTFIVWNDTLLPIAQDWNESADNIQRMVDDVQKVKRDLESLPRLEQEVVINVGPVQTPRREADVSIAFHEVVNAVLDRHSVLDPSFGAQLRGKLPKGALPTISRGKKIERLTGDLKFIASPSTVVAIIAELESSPHVESVNSVRISKDASESVKVHLVIEAWGFASNAPRGDIL